jgi:hypothetical protein
MKVSCFLMLALLVTETMNAAPLVFQSSGRQPSLLELYTSEGCSSCPPAEIWLSGLKYSPKLWSDFVPVAFHVEYWNYLGWRDPWSKEEFSDRQRAYAQAWNAQNIYTPEFVLNGREWSHGFWQKTVPAVAETGAGSLKVSSDDATHWQLSFVPAQNKKTTYEVHAALLVSGVSSDVKAGENAGRQLKHDFAAMAFTELPLVSHSNVFNSTFALEAKSKPNGGCLALAVWITVHGKSEPVQVTGGWLMNPEK